MEIVNFKDLPNEKKTDIERNFINKTSNDYKLMGLRERTVLELESLFYNWSKDKSYLSCNGFYYDLKKI